MIRFNTLASGCLLALLASGCSALTKWPDVNDNTANKTGGSGGEDAVGGSVNKGGATNKGGSGVVGGGVGTAGRSSSVGGIANVAGTASSSGGAGTSLGGNVSVGGSANTSGGVANAAGTGALIGGTSNQGGGITVAGGATGSGGTTTLSGGTAATAGGHATTIGGTTPIGLGGQGGGAIASGGSATSGGSTALGTGGGSGTTLAISTPTLAIGKTGVAYSGTVTASGASQYTWSIASGSLPSGVSLQNTTSAVVTIAGTPKEAGLFPLTLSVTDGNASKTVEVSLAVTHRVAFLSDRVTSGIKELFLTDAGAETPTAPVQLSAPIASGNVASFAWSPDGAKVAYTVTTGSGSTLLVSSVANPGSATSVSANVVKYLWLAEGEVLMYTTTPGGLYVLDTSTPEPWTIYPETSTSTSTVTVSTTMLVASPTGRKAAVAVTESAPAPISPSYFVYMVSWDSGTAPTRTLVGTQPGVPNAMSFSNDSGLLAVDAPSVGLMAYDLSTANPPSTTLTARTAHAWSPLGRSMLAQQNQLGTGLQFANYSTRWSQTTLLLNPSCTPIPGPWSPDGNHATYSCGADVRAYRNISAASANTDTSIFPSGFLTNSFTNVPSYGWSPDSQWIAFLADKDTNNLFDVYVVRWASPGVATKPYASSSAPGISAWQFAPNSSSVAFVGGVDTSTTPGLYLTTLPITGSPSAASALTSATDPAVQDDIAWLPGSRVILYRANDVGGAQLHAVHLTPSGASSTPVSISGASGTGVPSYRPAPTP